MSLLFLCCLKVKRFILQRVATDGQRRVQEHLAILSSSSHNRLSLKYRKSLVHLRVSPIGRLRLFEIPGKDSQSTRPLGARRINKESAFVRLRRTRQESTFGDLRRTRQGISNIEF
jgi:hypothetical protein